jgi:inner membrane transporter RhtA
MRPKLAAVPPHGYFVLSAIFHYLGPAFAVLLFARVDVLGVAWLRIASAAAFFALWRRPWRGLRARLLIAWGAVLAVMNCCFYLAIDRLPLGTVAAIVGFVFAFANAALFALYIVLGHRVAQRGASGGIDGLGASMLIAFLLVTPIAGWAVVPALTDPVAIAAGIGVGLCSSVIPYVTDQLAMTRLPRATYALLVSLLPATATVIGVVVLSQLPSPVEALGVGLVILGLAVHRERRADVPVTAPVTLSA